MKPLEVGRITRPHGLHGELKVRLYWRASRALEQTAQVRVVPSGRPGRVFRIGAVRRAARQIVLVKLEGVADLAQAEQLRGSLLEVEREWLPALGEGEYYLVDLIGARVLVGDQELGRVVDIQSYPTVDAMVIRTESGQLREQPMLDCWLEQVDVETGLVRLTSTEGLIG